MTLLLAPSPFKGSPFLGQVRMAQNSSEQLRRDGPVLQVELSPPDGGPSVTILAMVDTGASITTVNSQIAQSSGLPQTGSTQLSGVGGVQQSSIHAAAVNLPQYGVKVDVVQVATVPGQLPGVDMLIGRDLLQNLSLEYHGSEGVFNLTEDTAPPGTVAAPATPGTVLEPGAAPQNLPQPPASKSALPWILGGVAAVGLGIGALFLFKVL